MPPFAQRHRRDKIQVWPKIGDGAYGDPLLGDRIEIHVRWVNRVAEMADDAGNLISVTAQIVVAQDLPMQSLVWRGAFADLPGTAGLPESGIMQITAQSKATNLKGRVTRREYGLVRWGDTLPVEE